jgi:hypothetical protein
MNYCRSGKFRYLESELTPKKKISTAAENLTPEPSVRGPYCLVKHRTYVHSARVGLEVVVRPKHRGDLLRRPPQTWRAYARSMSVRGVADDSSAKSVGAVHLGEGGLEVGPDPIC